MRIIFNIYVFNVRYMKQFDYSVKIKFKQFYNYWTNRNKIYLKFAGWP